MSFNNIRESENSEYGELRNYKRKILEVLRIYKDLKMHSKIFK